MLDHEPLSTAGDRMRQIRLGAMPVHVIAAARHDPIVQNVLETLINTDADVPTILTCMVVELSRARGNIVAAWTEQVSKHTVCGVCGKSMEAK